jgi:hypothetical protein
MTGSSRRGATGRTMNLYLKRKAYADANGKSKSCADFPAA